ncbi:MAG: chemotaxis-specific protein-glutamate methyltransferase CheB [Rhodobacteraceae bacterium]|nr:chemotaxis-specific protein-glutamate methyltransferase CheB [Paracoccaceae bacterium]
MTAPPLPDPVLKKRVVIVDDSRTIRALIRATLSDDGRLEVVGEASDPYEARNVIKATNPDVITLDVEMPKMNGLDFLKNLMRLRPMPVVMVSSRTRENSEDAIRALSIGAVDCVHVARLQSDAVHRARFAKTIYTAAGAQIAQREVARQTGSGAIAAVARDFVWNRRLVLLGASTGGVEALERVLQGFPKNGPPVMIAQHMPAPFLKSFAERLNRRIGPEVRIAAEGDVAQQGVVLIAPGGQHHLAFASAASGMIATPPADGTELYVPTIDRLFKSAVGAPEKIVAVLLTGMGKDGAASMLELHKAGACTLAQSAETCVIDGMPRAARELGAVQKTVPLDDMTREILALCSIRGHDDG